MQKMTEADIERRRSEAAKRALEEAQVRKGSTMLAPSPKNLAGGKARNPSATAIGRKKGSPPIFSQLVRPAGSSDPLPRARRDFPRTRRTSNYLILVQLIGGKFA